MSNHGTTKISKIMTKKLETIGSSSTAQDIAKKMSMKKVSSILVVDDDKDVTPLGIVTEQDLVRKVCVNDKSSREVFTSQIISSPLITVNADSSPSDAADLMLKNKIKHLLVVEIEHSKDAKKNKQEDGKDVVKPVGIITPMDFTRYKVTGAPDYDNNDGNEDNKIEKILEYYKDDFDFA